MANYGSRKEVRQLADEVKVNPTPIQRNYNDVATELTQLYFSRFGFDNIEEIQEVYTKFYATALLCSNSGSRLINFVPESLKKAYQER